VFFLKPGIKSAFEMSYRKESRTNAKLTILKMTIKVALHNNDELVSNEEHSGALVDKFPCQK